MSATYTLTQTKACEILFKGVTMAETLIGARLNQDMTPQQLRAFHLNTLSAAAFDDVRVHDIISGLLSSKPEAYETAISGLSAQVHLKGRRTLSRALEFFSVHKDKRDQKEGKIEAKKEDMAKQHIGILSTQDTVSLSFLPEHQAT